MLLLGLNPTSPKGTPPETPTPSRAAASATPSAVAPKKTSVPSNLPPAPIKSNPSHFDEAIRERREKLSDNAIGWNQELRTKYPRASFAILKVRDFVAGRENDAGFVRHWLLAWRQHPQFERDPAFRIVYFNLMVALGSLQHKSNQSAGALAQTTMKDVNARVEDLGKPESPSPAPAPVAPQEKIKPKVSASPSSPLVNAVTDKDFEKKVLRSTLPVLVEFWADGCEPCHEMAPIVEATAKKFEGKVTFLRMNADENQVPVRLRIEGLPTLMLFDKGKPVDVYRGLTSQVDIETMIEMYFLLNSESI